MDQFFLSDKDIRDNLYPFTATRSAAEIRIGILTIREKWQAYLGSDISLEEETLNLPDNAMVLAANIIPSRTFVQSLIKEGRLSDHPSWSWVKIIQYPWHIFLWNDWAIREDYALVTTGRKSAGLPGWVQAIHPQNIFIEEGAVLSPCVINAETGPVYIGKNARILEGSMIRGPFALCENAVVKMGTRIYGATTIGPGCVVGGEIKNTVMFANSNKAHDGYLGDSVIGAWCNLGAGTSNSNVKNNASEIKMWSRAHGEMIATGLSKCGLIMGDYSRAAINTSFNTGTTVGICANIFGAGLTPKYIPDFSWGLDGNTKYTFDKAMEDVSKWKLMKEEQLTEKEKRSLKLIFEQN